MFRQRQNSPGERLLADFELLEQMRQQLTQRLVTDAALHDVRHLVRTRHDLHPRLVDVAETLCFLWMRSRVLVAAVITRICSNCDHTFLLVPVF